MKVIRCKNNTCHIQRAKLAKITGQFYIPDDHRFREVHGKKNGQIYCGHCKSHIKWATEAEAVRFRKENK